LIEFISESFEKNLAYVQKFFQCKIVNNLDVIPFLDDVIALYFVLKDPATPLTAKVTIAGALAYLILPVDAVPDITPVAGYTDDMGVLAVVIATLSNHIKEQHRVKAQEFLDSLKDTKDCDEEIPEKIT